MTQDLFDQKKAFRKKIKELKSSFTELEKHKKSDLIFYELEKREYFKKANHIMCYWSMTDEVQTIDFIIRHMYEKQFYLPVVRGNELEIRMFEGIETMMSGEAYGIMEPRGQLLTDFSELELIIVPGLAFDKHNNRLGRGKAYYDKFLLETSAVKVGVCFDFQFFDKVPANEDDIKMDEVIMA